MIDLKHEARNFATMDLPESTGDSVVEDIRYAYSLYNKALLYIRKGYDDLARQNLKKAIGLNQDFYPGRMLLGVCLFANGDRVGAMRMFNAIKDMRYKRLALSYYDYLTEEVEKPASQSGTRLILKDLYKAAAAAEKTLSDVTKPKESPLLVQAEEKKPKQNPEYNSLEEKKNKQSYHSDNITEGQLSFDDIIPEEPEKNQWDNEFDNVAPIIDDGFEIPHFVTKKPQTIITSRKNDGVVEEIVKQKRVEAQKVARYSGAEKKPFEFDHIYKKQIFSDNSLDTVEETPGTETSSNISFESGKQSILIAVASVLVLVYLTIVSVLLMHNVTDNRKLRNECEDLKKLYIESQVTPSPKPEALYTFEPVISPEPTSEITEEATPAVDE